MDSKHNLLIVGAALLLSLTAISIVPITDRFTSNSNNHNVLKAEATENGDISLEVMLTSGKYHVNTTIKGATLDQGNIQIAANSYAIWSNDSDSPMRGISGFYITFSEETHFGESSDPIFYGSFNPLTFEGIQSGLYHDLKTTKLPSYATSDYLTYRFESFDPVLTDCRYFLAIIPTEKTAFNISEFKVATPCSVEPSREDESVGTFSNYQDDILEKIPAEAHFPFVGNGSYTYHMMYIDDQQEPCIRFIQTSKNKSNFIAAIESEYSKEQWETYEGFEFGFYKKKVSEGDEYYTFRFEGTFNIGEDIVIFVIYYLGIQSKDFQ